MGNTNTDETTDIPNANKTIKIKIPKISIKKDDTTTKNSHSGTKANLKKINENLSIIKNKPGKKPETKLKPKLFHLKNIDEENTVPVNISQNELSSIFGENPESLDSNFSSNFLKKFSLRKRSGISKYDFSVHGSLVNVKLPPEYKLHREYWITKGLSKVFIVLNQNTRMNEYLLYEPALTPFEYTLLERLHEDLRDVLILEDEDIGGDRKELLYLKTNELVKYYGINLSNKSRFKIEYYLARNYLGWGRINPLMLDPSIEDISCDGDGIPIYLFHRQEQNIKTNIIFDTDSLLSLAVTLAQRSGKHISAAMPIIDATLPEGSRLQLTYGSEVTSRGTSFTVRKFREEPFTPIDLMELNTFNSDMLVYFWLTIENNMSLIFLGGTASGKTTSLNAVSLFIPPLSKIISIEDTRELTLFHDNWIASVTRESTAEGSTNIDMFILLKAAMRQRPEYILVGEVRGHEAQTLFQAMNTGHTTFSTMHAGSVDAAIHRLENEPLNVPRNMLQALNILSIQKQIQIGPDRVRRSEEIVEIAGIDPATGNIMVNTVFEYDPIVDNFKYTGRSQTLGQIATINGWSREQLTVEMNNRNKVLHALKDQGMHDYIRFTKVIQGYYIDKDHIMQNIDNLSEIIS